MERMTDVVEQMVAAAVNDAAFKDRIRQAGGTHDLLRGPLRLVITGAATRPRAQEADHGDSFYARLLRRADQYACAFDVHGGVSLFADLPVDAGAVGHGIAASQAMSNCLLVRDGGAYKLRVWQPAEGPLASVGSTRDEH